MSSVVVNEFPVKDGKTLSAVAKSCELLNGGKKVLYLTSELTPIDILDKVSKKLGKVTDNFVPIGCKNIDFDMLKKRLELMAKVYEVAPNEVSIVIDADVDSVDVNIPTDVYIFSQAQAS